MSEAIKALAKEHNINITYRVLIIDVENGVDDYLKKPMTESEVNDFIKRNEKKLDRCTVLGFSNIGTADSSSRIVFKEHRMIPGKAAAKPRSKPIDKEAMKKAREELRKIINEGNNIGAKPKR